MNITCVEDGMIGGARENRGMKKPELAACEALALIVEYENSALCVRR